MIKELRGLLMSLIQQMSGKKLVTDPGYIIIALALFYIAEAILCGKEDK